MDDTFQSCMVTVLDRRTACGRKPERWHQTTNRDDVTCADCKDEIGKAGK